METADVLTELSRVPKGDWVILSADQSHVVAHDADLQKAILSAQEKGEKNGVIMKAESLGRYLIGCNL